MPNPPSLTKTISVLLEQHGAMSQAALMAATGRTNKQVSNALDGLTRHGAAKYDLKTRQYHHIYRFDRYPTQPAPPVTEAEKQAVYALCTGMEKRDIIAATGFTRALVSRCLVRLSEQGKVQYTPDGWMQTAYVPPQKALTITPEDVEWQRYWSPLNRQQRREDRYGIA